MAQRFRRYPQRRAGTDRALNSRSGMLHETFWHRNRHIGHVDAHRIHPGQRRAGMGPFDQGPHCAGMAAGPGLHAAIVSVADPAGHAQALGGFHHGLAVMHALHAALDAQVAGDEGAVIISGIGAGGRA